MITTGLAGPPREIVSGGPKLIWGPKHLQIYFETNKN